MLESSFTRSAGVPDIADDGAGERGKESALWAAAPCSPARSAGPPQSRRRCIRVRLAARRSSRSDRDHEIIGSTPATVPEFRYRCRDRILVCPGLGNQPSWPDLGRRAVPEADPLATIERTQPSRYPAASLSPQADPYQDGRVPKPAPGATAAGAARLRRVTGSAEGRPERADLCSTPQWRPPSEK
jgi:hypothetical protein